MDSKYQTLFASQIRAIDPSEETRNEAKASLRQLRNLLPVNINPEDEPALLFVAGNLAVGGYVNLNDDGVDIETALAICKKFEKQQINLEHNRKQVVGYIIHAGFSELETDRVITEAEAREANKPVNIAIIIALWRAVNKDLCNYIEEASVPTHPDFNSLSLSFEVGFEGYYIVGLPKGTYNIAEAAIVVRPEDSAFERYSNALKANKGSGLAPEDSNLRVYRIINEGVVPLGGGIVTVPAAAVQGLIAIKEQLKEVEDEDSGDDEHEDECEHKDYKCQEHEMAASLEKTRNTIIAFIVHGEKNLQKIEKNRVSVITSINLSMKPADIQALKERASKATEVKELTEVVASATEIIDAITAESVRQEQLRKEAESHTAEIEKAKSEAQAASEQLKKDLDAVRAELDTIKQAQAAVEAEQKFNERMNAVEATFDFTDDERAEIVADIRGLDDEAFAKWMDKSKKLMKEKTKDFKKKAKDEAEASRQELIAKFSEEGVKMKSTDTGFEIEEIIASAKDNVISKEIENIIKPEANDLKSLATKALAGVKFHGAAKK